MLFDPDRALDFLATDRPAATWPAGAPDADYLRSPAAARVGALAADAGLFSFHFEHRAHLALPLEWLPDGADPSLAEPPEWVDGVLPEAKYQSFQHDLLIGSFHPGHRGKWTTHELCHALVGFGWRPDASPLFTATAGRLAELLPVVLYYFLDEVRLRRCADHAGGGPLYRSWCPACEAEAAGGPVAPGPDDREKLADASRFLDRELAAVARTRRLGRPIGHRWGSLDLCTDGLAYAHAHGRRLGSDAFGRFAACFLAEGQGWSATLDALEARVVAVTRSLVEGADLEPMAASASDGRWRWTVQDLGWRMAHAAELAAPELRARAWDVIDALAAAPWGPETLAEAHRDWPLDPDPFAVGYPIPSLPADPSSVREGLRTACPLVLEAFDDAGLDPAADFAAADPPLRVPLADRFAAWVGARHGPEVATLARFEAALRHAGTDELAPVLGVGEGEAEVSARARLLDEPVDPIALSDAVESGALGGVLEGGRLRLRSDQGLLDAEPTRLLVGRSAAGEVAVVELDDEADPELLAALGLATWGSWGV